MAKGKDVVVRKDFLPANWEKQMQEDAKKAVKQEASVAIGQFMSIRGGILTFQQTPVPGNKLQGVILAAILENAYYTKDFDPSNPSSPDCYAFGEDEAEMKPHEQAPEKQSPTCRECQWNKFGSAEKGRGKACKNGRRMAIVHADSLKGELKDATVAFLKIPPTSLPGWAGYVKALLSAANRPPYGVVTEIAVVPDPRSQYKVTFNLVKKIEDRKALGQCFQKHKELQGEIGFPYQVIEGLPAGKGKGKKAAAAARPGPGFGAQPARRAGAKF